MKVTVCQHDPRPEAIETSFGVVADHVATNEPDLLLLPEMPFGEWLAAEPPADLGRWHDSVSSHRDWIARLGELAVDVVVGSRPIVTTAGSRRNEAFLWSTEAPEPTPIHQKHHLPDEPGYWEHSWYDRGPCRFDTARAGDALIGVQICTEMWFFEWARHYAAERVDLLLIPRATPRGSIDKWVAGGRVAAVCSGAFSLSSNLVTPVGVSADCGGVGWVIDPEGEVLGTTSAAQPCVTVEVDLDVARRAKTTYPRYVRPSP